MIYPVGPASCTSAPALALQTGPMGDTTTYPARTNGLWKGMLVACAVLTAVGVVILALAPSWLGALNLLLVALHALQWWAMRPGHVVVLDRGLEFRGVDRARLRPRRVEWSQIRGMHRPRWTQIVVLELEGGREQPLPELSPEDTEALVAAVTARLPVGTPVPGSQA